MKYVAIVTLLSLVVACNGQVCGVDLSFEDGSQGCCANIGTCSNGIGECSTIGLSFLSNIGGAYDPALQRCYQSDCFLVFPASCSLIDRTLSPCEDNGDLCSNAFPELEITPGPLPVPSPSPSPVPSPSPSPSPVPSPVPSPSPSPIPSPVPSPSPSPVPSPSPPPNSDGTSCIAGHQTVTIDSHKTKKIIELKFGDVVLTDTGFQKYIGNIHNGSISQTLKIHTNDGKSIELTADHLIKTDKGFAHAGTLRIGSSLVGSKVVLIEERRSYVISPLTKSGTIVVNDVVLSCYANVHSHNLANWALFPARRANLVNKRIYLSILVYIYNVLPQWLKRNIATSDSIYF